MMPRFALLLPLLLATVCSLSALAQQPTFNVVASFPQTTGLPAQGLVQNSSGSLFGVARFGGTGDSGALFQVDDSAGTAVPVANFASIGGEVGSEHLGLAADSAGNIYGVTPYGGATGDGSLWRFNSATGLVKLANFTGATTGEKPHCAVAWDGDTSTLYGTCEGGGQYSGGTLWKWTSAGGLVRLYSFQNYGDALSLGGRPQYIALNGSVLYGIALERDPGTGEDIPVLWSRSAAGVMSQAAVFDSAVAGFPVGALVACDTGVVGISYTSPDTLSGTPRLWRYAGAKKITVVKSFAATDADLTIGTADNFGVCGTTKAGQVWSWAPDEAFTKIGTLPVATTGAPGGQIVVDSTGEIRGTALIGTDGAGTVWHWSSTATDVVASFDGLEIGGDPKGLYIDAQGSIFGIETIKQLVWRYNPATGPIPIKIGDVESPLIGFVTYGGVAGDGDGNLFGFTRLGPSGNAGVLWRWSALTGLAKVGTFGTTALPGAATGAISCGPDGTVYGTTAQIVGAATRTHLWKWTRTGGLVKLATLDAADGGAPTATVLVSPDGGAVYGTCTTGGDNNKGTLWAWTEADGVLKLADFGTPASVPSPGEGLAVSPLGAVFGVTKSGGTTGDGRIWKWLPVSGLSAVKDFDRATTGSMLSTNETGLILATDGLLYGTTSDGGTGGVGTLWRCNVSSATPAITTLKHFSPLEMAHPSAQRLVQKDDGSIYGLGLHGIWRYGLPAAAASGPAAVTLEASYTSATHVVFEGAVNALGADADVTFEYGTDPDTLDQSEVASPDVATGADPTPVNLDLTGLEPGTAYYYRVKITNTRGTAFGDVAKVTTGPVVNPLVVTKPATDATTSGLTLNAAITPKSDIATAVSFDLGTSATSLSTTISASSLSDAAAATVEVPVASLQPHTKYYFRAKASNDNGSASGAILSASTLNNAPTAVDDEVTVLPSGAVTLLLVDNDTDPDSDALSVLSFTNPPVAAGKVTRVGANLVFTAAPGFTSTTFNYTVSDGFGGTSTAKVTITRGKASLSEIAHTVSSAGGDYVVKITTTDAWATVSGVPWASFTPVRGEGTTDVTVHVLPTAAATSRIGTLVIGGIAHTVTQNGVVKPTLSAPATIPPGMISADYHMMLTTTGMPVTYTAGNLPPGLKISATGSIDGRPTKAGSYAVAVKASNAAGFASVNFTLLVKTLPETKVGNYSALIERHALNNNFGGLLTMSVAPTGALTGVLRSGAEVLPFVDRVDACADSSVPCTSAFVIARRGLPSLSVILTFGNGLLDANSLGITITQVVIGALAPSPVARGAGWRLTHSGTSAGIYAGTYNQLLDLASNMGDINTPQGNGFFVTRIVPAGVATYSGKLADGTAIAGSTALWPNGSIPLWLMLYTNTGSLYGDESFVVPAGVVTGMVDWLRKPQAATSPNKYRAGFGPVSLSIGGSRYTAPTAGTILLGLRDKPDNARLQFFEGGLASAEQASKLNQLLRITLQNKAELALAGSANNLTGVKLVLVPATGMFSGSFTLRDSNTITPSKPYLRTASFEGLIAPNLTKGAGYFLLTELPNARILSGQVVLDPAPSAQ